MRERLELSAAYFAKCKEDEEKMQAEPDKREGETETTTPETGEAEEVAGKNRRTHFPGAKDLPGQMTR